MPLAPRARTDRASSSRIRAGIPPWWLAVLAALILVPVTLDVLHGGWLAHLDHSISRQMVRWDLRHRTVKPLIYAFTLFGQRGTVLGVSAPIVAYLCWRDRSPRPVVLYVVALIAIFVVVYAFKDATGRTAPPVDLLHTSAGESYPSGHLVNAAVLWWLLATIADRVPVPTWIRSTLTAVAWVAPIAVVVSMTLLDYHWISDFIAAICVAIVLRFGLILLIDRLYPRGVRPFAAP